MPTTRILFYVKDCENGKIDIRLLFIRFEISHAHINQKKLRFITFTARVTLFVTLSCVTRDVS